MILLYKFLKVLRTYFDILGTDHIFSPIFSPSILGYRHIKLRNDSYQPICLPTLFVDIVTKDFVPESFTGWLYVKNCYLLLIVCQG